MKTELFLKGRLRHDLSNEEELALENAVVRTFVLEGRQGLVRRGERLESSYYIVSGTMLRFIDNRKGERQIVGINISGDFVDLHGYAMKRLDHSIGALAPTVLAEVPHTAISKLVDEYPHLARVLWFSTLLDAAMHREWIFRLGRMNAETRIAHLICELIERLKFIGIDDQGYLPIPLLQRDYAEACGITPVHTNRTFKSLRDRGLISRRGDGYLQILNANGLRKLAEFNGDYLYGSGDLAIDKLSDRVTTMPLAPVSAK